MNNNYDIVFRADANPNIGMGHVMRCLSVADAFNAIGKNVLFVLADDSVVSLINDRGFSTAVLKSDFRDMESELESWPDGLQPEIIILDSYFVTEGYFKNLKEKYPAGALTYIDDVATFPYPVDILVDYNAYGPYVDYEGLYAGADIKLPRLILGPTVTPLRGMFKGIPRKTQPEQVRDILVSTGGSDELHLAIKLLQTIANRDNEERVYHFLIGTMNKDREEIHSMADGLENVVLHENVTDMKSLIQSCDIAISAAGSTMYEICACGVPMLTYSIADNQIPGAEAFEKQGLALNVGDLRVPESIDANEVISGELYADAQLRIIEAAEKLADDYNLRCKIGTRMQELIDGCGAERLVEELIVGNRGSK
ncbi:UDP-2,4-diacetamido-2,4,6-trideoxy-beta-L-altropyranose hydrolase [Pseudobutyrivibrio sp. 49]|uniref:UDP-2,4-diacetamido-2,4, 6-trideoxy-beta-L-altropyranose hydrolase n=1 Tax=Pseudobutyrivibrio sp. 49 TaxID=1855344 RepID=UPI000890EC5E|nr:UDP-2,4-diacetamido-2,4,6-trideoxy-beta-L-altropyranose hydrolase [Pseudobutyrivibrio sp. 49]SDH58517.1 UDP-2,4-diacetamido-2,4,6-trideoxy-beta-L-altropyranose hydrolase [Pseudobutyrivibrio sp. 49]